MSLKDRFTVQVWIYGVSPLTSTADGFVIGETNRGRLGAAYFNKLRFGDLNTPTDVTSMVESVDIQRGRRRALDSFDGGTCTIVLDSTDRRFDQLNTAGTYSILVPSSGGRKQLFRRGRAVRVVAVGTSDAGNPVSFALWSGWIDAIRSDYAAVPSAGGALQQRTTVQCVDAFAIAARVDRNEADIAYGGDETMGPRVRRWAEAAGLMLESNILGARGGGYYVSAGFEKPSFVGPGWRYGVAGDEGTYALQATYLSENALTAMKAAAASQDALLYVNRDGQIVPQLRSSSPVTPFWAASSPKFTDSNSPSALTINLASLETLTLTDRNIPIEEVPTIATDTTDVCNYVSLARAGGTARTAVDGASTDVVGRVAFTRTDLINTNDSDVDAVAAAILARHASEVKTTISDVRVRPWLSDAAMAAAMLIELTQAVYFVHTTILPLGMQCYVQGIRHEIRPLVDWTTTFTLSEAQ